MKRSLLSGLALAGAASLPLSQTGAWTDGELLVRSVGAAPGSQVQTLYRIAPETGHGEVLFEDFYYLGGAGGVAFDSYRGRVLMNAGMAPSLFTPRLLFVDQDGTWTTQPDLDDERLRALAPTGDGRVYFQRFAGNPGLEIQYLDAADQVHTLLDETGLAPLSLAVEHMLYHAPTNALLATTSGAFTPGGCVSGESSVYRIPLSPDGGQAAGPVVCASVLPGISNNIMTLDALPGGDVLLQMAGGQFFNETARRVDPVTLTNTLFASPSMADIDGAYWSARIGKMVLLDDPANVLRTYGEGETGLGSVLATDVVVSPSTTGFSPTEAITEIDVFGPSCAGTTLPYGSGLAGSGGFTPALSASPCPDVGHPFTLRVDDALGGALGLLLAGFSETALPLVGGTLYVFPFAQTIPASAGGTPGLAGDGTFLLPLQFSGPGFVGVDVFLQAAYADPGAPFGISLTNGLQLSIG